jgi:hypothetical protein
VRELIVCRKFVYKWVLDQWRRGREDADSFAEPQAHYEAELDSETLYAACPDAALSRLNGMACRVDELCAVEEYHDLGHHGDLKLGTPCYADELSQSQEEGGCDFEQDGDLSVNFYDAAGELTVSYPLATFLSAARSRIRAGGDLHAQLWDVVAQCDYCPELCHDVFALLVDSMRVEDELQRWVCERMEIVLAELEQELEDQGV